MRRPPRACDWPACPELVEVPHRRCDRHRVGKEDGRKLADARRGSSSSRGYGGRWRFIRAAQLRREPLCRACASRGLRVPATEVDHIDPLPPRGTGTNKRDNLQSLCKPCHSRKTAGEVWHGKGRP